MTAVLRSKIYALFLDLPPEAKYDSTIEKIARAVRPLSPAHPKKTCWILLKRALFAWLIADGGHASEEPRFAQNRKRRAPTALRVCGWHRFTTQ